MRYRIADFAFNIFVLLCGAVAGLFVIGSLDQPPVEIRGAITVNPVIKRGEKVEIREIVLKRYACSSIWSVHVLSYPDNKVQYQYQEPGGFVGVSNMPQTVIWSINTPDWLKPGRYTIRASGKYDSCDSWLRSSWSVQIPDVFFEVKE